MAESASARQLGIAPTGTRRAGRRRPSAAPSNFYMEPGQRSREELLAAFPEAVLVVELIGWAPIRSPSDYSAAARRSSGAGGEIAEPIAEITIASNLIDMFATLEPASDLSSAVVDAPTILVPEMTGRA